jgi:hypothetical protein
MRTNCRLRVLTKCVTKQPSQGLIFRIIQGLKRLFEMLCGRLGRNSFSYSHPKNSIARMCSSTPRFEPSSPQGRAAGGSDSGASDPCAGPGCPGRAPQTRPREKLWPISGVNGCRVDAAELGQIILESGA